MMKTKILFVMPSLGSGGAEKSFVSMLPLLSHDEFEIHVMVVKEEGLFYPLLPTPMRKAMTKLWWAIKPSFSA